LALLQNLQPIQLNARERKYSDSFDYLQEIIRGFAGYRMSGSGQR